MIKNGCLSLSSLQKLTPIRGRKRVNKVVAELGFIRPFTETNPDKGTETKVEEAMALRGLSLQKLTPIRGWKQVFYNFNNNIHYYVYRN